MQIDELMETQANADASMKGHLYKYMHLHAHTLFSGTILKRKGQRLKNIYVLEFLLSSLTSLSSV